MDCGYSFDLNAFNAILGYNCSKFRAIKSSRCPKDLDLPECTVDMIYGELCEADKTLPDGNDNFNIDNCGDFDIFECSGY